MDLQILPINGLVRGDMKDELMEAVAQKITVKRPLSRKRIVKLGCRHECELVFLELSHFRAERALEGIEEEVYRFVTFIGMKFHFGCSLCNAASIGM